MKTAKSFSFEARIEGHGGGAFVRIPFDVEKEYGKKRLKIQADIGGEAYRGSLVRMGTPYHILLIRKDIRQKLGLEVGDQVEIRVREDTAPRVVVLPQDVKTAFAKDEEVMARYQELSYTHQKEFMQWITGAKREATRINRIEKAMEMIRAGEKR